MRYEMDSLTLVSEAAQAGVRVLVEPNIADRIIDWKPISGRVAYGYNLEGENETFLEEVQCALSEVPNTESLILMGDFNAHVGVDAEKWNGVIGRKGPSDLNNNGMKLLRFCANNGLSFMSTSFEH
ncbi:unnamed protein product [Soboliphyme baturini]|uniref:Endo/exonuclease/phosphatase domain-containing protein n=1 Tax=Soboliphyme baturini TaxID=241478 RepID=A0A183I9C9_9BILA|nr:unnamed protein product [Soboliphyme baturini]